MAAAPDRLHSCEAGRAGRKPQVGKTAVNSSRHPAAPPLCFYKCFLQLRKHKKKLSGVCFYFTVLWVDRCASPEVHCVWFSIWFSSNGPLCYCKQQDVAGGVVTNQEGLFEAFMTSQRACVRSLRSSNNADYCWWRLTLCSKSHVWSTQLLLNLLGKVSYVRY